MASAADANAFRERWNQNGFSGYKNEWIAFRNKDVVGRASELSQLLTTFGQDIKNGKSPIFAFVDAEIFQ